MLKNTNSPSRRQTPSPRQQIDFRAINTVALRSAEDVCRWLLPNGRRAGREYLALNPKRADHTVGSFKINLTSGVWKDFSSGDGGGDLIALTAWALDLHQGEAARRLAAFLGISTEVQP
ncbi:MAG TPA: hypothetical protein VHI72_09175 [Hyphomicrobiaceae bacterium]|jgi:hypothetical protein|nr:hypothetical protein [Hyphomicrobiaceae bacterium]